MPHGGVPLGRASASLAVLHPRSWPIGSRGSPRRRGGAPRRSSLMPARLATGSRYLAPRVVRMNEEVPRRQTRVLDKQRMRSFLLGGAAGILAGILLAPRSGRELRGSVMERAGEARERGRESLFEARERMQERLSEAREGSQQGPSSGLPPEDSAPRRPHLRDVSSEVAGEP